jgi:regulator of nucleoside diphosphate kinase
MEQITSLRDPPLLVGDRSEATLRSFANAALTRAPEVAAHLLDEVDRADVVTESEMPDDVVAIGSFVTYRVQLTGRINTIQLVPPHEADLAALRVPVVSEIGAALIGLKPGQQIWWKLGGLGHVLEVLRVSRDPD